MITAPQLDYHLESHSEVFANETGKDVITVQGRTT